MKNNVLRGLGVLAKVAASFAGMAAGFGVADLGLRALETEWLIDEHRSIVHLREVVPHMDSPKKERVEKGLGALEQDHEQAQKEPWMFFKHPIKLACPLCQEHQRD